MPAVTRAPGAVGRTLMEPTSIPVDHLTRLCMSTVTTTSEASAADRSLAGKYLTFVLGGEFYAIPVLQVREIIRHTHITTVPRMPAHVKGVLNLRGKVIPIVDLRLKFQLERAEIAERTCIVVVQVKLGSGGRASMGLIVDAVEAVANIASKDIEPTPDFGGHANTAHILGMAKVEQRVIALLDIDLVATADEIEALSQVGR
jgi:purine-binding chemotaxis protein CheW